VVSFFSSLACGLYYWSLRNFNPFTFSLSAHMAHLDAVDSVLVMVFPTQRCQLTKLVL